MEAVKHKKHLYTTDELLPCIYGDLIALAEVYSRTRWARFEPAALVHETFLRLAQQRRSLWNGRAHLLAIGARTMQRVLVDHARRERAVKRGGNRTRIALDSSLQDPGTCSTDAIDLRQAVRDLKNVCKRLGAVIELRFFKGYTVAEVARLLGVSPQTVRSDWNIARAWLRERLK